jgi:hypothetical protein
VAKAQIEKHYAAMQPGFTCAEYEDFRVMLDKDKSIDAILCATPDHLQRLRGRPPRCAPGATVYCRETAHAQISRRPAKWPRSPADTKRATSTGNQGHSTRRHPRDALEHLQAGTIRHGNRSPRLGSDQALESSADRRPHRHLRRFPPA